MPLCVNFLLIKVHKGIIPILKGRTLKTTAYIIVNDKESNYYKRYWGGTQRGWVDSLKEAKFYATYKNAEKIISRHQLPYKKTPAWEDNAIWEVEISTIKVEGAYKDGQKLGG